jgi:hypothetical protein
MREAIMSFVEQLTAIAPHGAGDQGQEPER